MNNTTWMIEMIGWEEQKLRRLEVGRVQKIRDGKKGKNTSFSGS